MILQKIEDTAGGQSGILQRVQRELWQVARVRRNDMLRSVIVLVAIGLVIPLLADAFWIKTLTAALVLALATTGLAMLYSQLGLISLCQFALVGVGGWIALRLGHALHCPFEYCVLAGGLGAALIGIVVGLPALRLRGLYLALVTLMMAGGFQVLIVAVSFPDGGAGFWGKNANGIRELLPRPSIALSDSAYFIYVMAWFIATILLLRAARLSAFGRSWALIRRGEAVATSAGVNVLYYQSCAFGIAGLTAGVAGALLAGTIGQLDGASFSASESVMMFALTIVGGAYHWTGAVASGVLLRALPSLFTDLGVNGHLTTVIFGLALLYSIANSPRGISGDIAGAWKRWRSSQTSGRK